MSWTLDRPCTDLERMTAMRGTPLTALSIGMVTSDSTDSLDMPYGRLTAGGPADIAIFAPDQYWTVSARSLVSQGKNTPFVGYELKGRVRKTLVAGVVVHSE